MKVDKALKYMEKNNRKQTKFRLFQYLCTIHFLKYCIKTNAKCGKTVVAMKLGEIVVEGNYNAHAMNEKTITAIKKFFDRKGFSTSIFKREGEMCLKISWDKVVKNKEGRRVNEQ